MEVRVVSVEHDEQYYSDLTIGNVYRVIGIEGDMYRIISDEGRPYLFPAEIFEVVEHAEPDDWISWVGAGGERYAYPLPLSAPGFFEDYFDDKPEAVGAFWRYIASLIRR